MGRKMKVLSRGAGALVAVLALVGGLAAVAPGAGAVTDATVSGTVTRPSGAPLGPGASVLFCPQPVPSTNASFCTFVGGFLTTIGGGGTYSAQVPPGTWYAAAIVGTAQSDPVGPVTLTDGQVLTGQDFSFSYGQVHGTVRTTGGDPAAFTSVSFCPGLQPTCGSTSPISTQSGADGTYAVTLGGGTWTGSAQTNAGAVAAPSTVTLADGDDATVNFQLAVGSIAGSLLDASGNPTSYSTGLEYCSSGSCHVATITGPAFVADGIVPGTYAVYAASPFSLGGGGLWLPESPTPVVVNDGETTSGVVLRLGGGSIGVSVGDGTTGISGVSVQPCLQGHPEAPNGEYCAGAGNTDATGHDTLANLPDGTYSLKIAAPGYASTLATGVVVSGGSAPPVNVTLGLAGSVTGTVSGALDTQTVVVACPGVDPDANFTAFPGLPCYGGQMAIASGDPLTYTVGGVAGDVHLRAYTGHIDGFTITVTGVSPATAVTVPPGGTATAPLTVPSPVDGNGDGIPDALQANVTTLPAGTGGGDVTIASPDGTILSAVTASDVPASPTPPAGATFPVGVLGFEVDGVAPGGTADVTIYMPAGSNPTGYLKLIGGAWVDFSSHVTISGDVVTLHLQDGDAFDTDPTPGVIGDPGGPVSGYAFPGFQAPIDNGKINMAKAGQTVPVKWRLTDAEGAVVSDASSFVSVRSSGGNCAGGATDDVESYSTGSSGLQYLGDGVWQFNWKTAKIWSGQCRTMTLTLADGTTHTAEFKFK